MARSAPDFSELLKRFDGMSRKDRQAVLDHFSPDERVAFETAAEADQQAREEEQRRQRVSDRQFLGYSPQLANLVESAVAGNAEQLTQAAAKALDAEHRSAIEAQSQHTRSVWQSLSEWFQGLVGGKDERPA